MELTKEQMETYTKGFYEAQAEARATCGSDEEFEEAVLDMCGDIYVMGGFSQEEYDLCVDPKTTHERRTELVLQADLRKYKRHLYVGREEL